MFTRHFRRRSAEEARLIAEALGLDLDKIRCLSIEITNGEINLLGVEWKDTPETSTTTYPDGHAPAEIFA